MDGDKPDKGRRGFIWAGVGTVVGIAASQLYEVAARLDERFPSALRGLYRAEIQPYLDQLKACKNRLIETQSGLSNMGSLENEYNTELKKAYEDLGVAIDGVGSVINKYIPILGSDALIVEKTMLDLLKEHQEIISEEQKQISQLGSQITILEDRIKDLDAKLTEARKYGRDRILFLDDFEKGLNGWEFYFGEYGTFGEDGYGGIVTNPEEVTEGNSSLKVVSAARAYSHSIADRFVNLNTIPSVATLATKFKQDDNVDSIEFSLTFYDGSGGRAEGAIQWLKWPKRRWRFWGKNREWNELNYFEENHIDEINDVQLTIDLENRRYREIRVNKSRLLLTEELDTLPEAGTPLSLKVHFEHRPYPDVRSTVLYDSIYLKN